MSAQLLKKINQFLALGAAVLLGIVLWRLLVPDQAGFIQKKMDKEAAPAVLSAADVYDVPPQSPIVFDEKLFSKPIFKSLTPNLRSSSAPFTLGSRGFMSSPLFPGGASASPGSEGAGSAVEQLKYIGILPGDPPQVVLEDNTKHKTYYLNKGQSEDGITIEEIELDSVTVTYGSSTKQFPR